jgi:hypothetical protein
LHLIDLTFANKLVFASPALVLIPLLSQIQDDFRVGDNASLNRQLLQAGNDELTRPLL